MNKIKEIASTTYADVVASIYQDDNAEPPESDIVRIAYRGSWCTTLGNQHCTDDELDQIGKDIADTMGNDYAFTDANSKCKLRHFARELLFGDTHARKQ